VRIFYVDGEYVPHDKAFIPVDDLAVLRGFGVFDIIRTYNGKPYFFKEHIKRLENSAKKIGLKLLWTQKEIENIVLETLNKNPDIDEANIRIIITGGSSYDFMTPAGNPRLIVLITPINKYPDFWYKNGVKIISMQLERDIPDAKSTSYIPAAMALKSAKKQDAIEVLYVSRDHYALEGTTSNVFGFIENKLITPDKDILKGITRQAIIDLSKDHFSKLTAVLRSCSPQILISFYANILL